MKEGGLKRVFVDGHVHVHDGFSLRRLCRRALAVSRDHGCPFFLWVVDAAGQQGFVAFREWLEASSWTLGDTGEASSFTISEGESALTVLSGRQLVSAEGVEVLSLGGLLEGPPKDRAHALDRLVAEILESGSPAVLPWGFGKWLGPRRKVLLEFLREPQRTRDPRIFLGDIRARCWPWRPPGELAPSLPTLAGSDPLPLPGGEGEVGRFGFEIELASSDHKPLERLREALLGGCSPRLRGSPGAPHRVLQAQLRYRLRSTR